MNFRPNYNSVAWSKLQNPPTLPPNLVTHFCNKFCVCYVKAEKPAHIYLELIPKEEREWTPIGFKAGGSETKGGKKQGRSGQ